MLPDFFDRQTAGTGRRRRRRLCLIRTKLTFSPKFVFKTFFRCSPLTVVRRFSSSSLSRINFGKKVPPQFSGPSNYDWISRELSIKKVVCVAHVISISDPFSPSFIHFLLFSDTKFYYNPSIRSDKLRTYKSLIRQLQLKPDKLIFHTRVCCSTYMHYIEKGKGKEEKEKKGLKTHTCNDTHVWCLLHYTYIWRIGLSGWSRSARRRRRSGLLLLLTHGVQCEDDVLQSPVLVHNLLYEVSGRHLHGQGQRRRRIRRHHSNCRRTWIINEGENAFD